MILIRKRAAALAAAAAIAVLLSPGPAMADKLVIFKNGKALLVTTAEEDGQWLKVSFGGDDWMSVPLSSIAEVTEAELSPASRVAAGAPNQVREGEAKNYSNRGSVQDDSRGARSLARGNDGDVLEQAEEDVRVSGAAGRSTARTARPSAQQQNNPLIPGLTPLNTNPNPAAGRSGLITRRNRFSDTDQAAQEEQQEQPAPEDDN